MPSWLAMTFWGLLLLVYVYMVFDFIRFWVRVACKVWRNAKQRQQDPT